MVVIVIVIVIIYFCRHCYCCYGCYDYYLFCSDALQNSASTSGSRPAEEEEGKLGEAMHIKGLLHENTEEMRSILRALNGEYIEPQAGGDLLRDGAGVLPTGVSTASSPLQNIINILL